MKGQVIEGAVTAAILNTFGNILGLILEHWITICVMLWILSSGVLILYRGMNPLNAFGLTLYTFYMFLIRPIPIPVVVFGYVLGNDIIIGSMLLMFNAIKYGLAIVFHVMLFISGLFYAWNCLMLTLTVMEAFS
jgi:hypothetical protein